MHVSKELVLVGRVLSETRDHVTLEVGKHEGAKFTLQQDENGETVGGDQFYTLLMCRTENGALVPWLPWGED